MTDEELIARLRGWARDIQAGSKAIWAMDQDLKEAADRIEALVKERDQWIEHTKNAVWADSEELKLANARAERLEAALLEIDALDPEVERIGACSENAIRGLVLRMGEIARSALKGDDHE